MIGLFLNKYALAAVGIVLAIAAIYGKGRMDGNASCIATIETMDRKANEAADKAKKRIDDLCARDPDGCLRDDWTRDGDR
jgi:hypothetical protein